ncbi:Chromosome partition protein Smc [uncultured archaeon]|nr:Chromosome partition protein Smc [uncultured archaeon]
MVEETEDNVSIKGSANSFMERLQEASSELGSVKSSFSKSMDDLSKIQSMLNLDGLNQMDSMIRSFEQRLTESERRREEAAEGARRYSVELEKEKERLVKLWDAYKNQEESLSAQEKRAAELEEKLRNTEQVHMQFERDATARIQTLTEKINEREQDVQQMEDMKQQVMRFDNIRTQMDTTIDSMRRDLITKDDVIGGLEKQVEELRGFEQLAEFKTKFEETSTELDKEKERLTKLFRLYEETESENKQLKEDLRGWQNWFESNEGLFAKLFDSVENLKHSNIIESAPISTDEEVEFSASQEMQPDSIERPKRKLRFRK